MTALTLLLLVAAQPTDQARFAKWEKEIAGIEKRLQADPPKRDGVIFVGSSSIRLWKLDQSFPGMHYTNVGFGGSEIRDCTHFAPRLITPYHPRAIVFYAGDNDIASGRKAEQVAGDFKTFAMTVHKTASKCRILYLPVKPSIARWGKFSEQAKANKLVKEYCDKSGPKFGYIDIVPAMLGEDGKPIPELFAKDGLHMSPAGYEKWTALVRAALEK
ncbi:MAG TPA: GDSL-type esterase/lipase family protein [Urbifossiella sp.]|nr:GDSL-type esterase/lipase family protein [Urbifossiella sp.]